MVRNVDHAALKQSAYRYPLFRQEGNTPNLRCPGVLAGLGHVVERTTDAQLQSGCEALAQLLSALDDGVEDRLNVGDRCCDGAENARCR
jgi:hypothetical protein